METEILKTAEQTLRQLKLSNCDGVMIGRGCLKNPWIFLEAQALRKNLKENIEKNTPEMINRLKTHLEKFYEERLFLLQLKKFCAWFSAGAPLSAPFRKNLFMEKDRTRVMDLIEEFFAADAALTSRSKETEYGPELMRGHG